MRCFALLYLNTLLYGDWKVAVFFRHWYTRNAIASMKLPFAFACKPFYWILFCWFNIVGRDVRTYASESHYAVVWLRKRNATQSANHMLNECKTCKTCKTLRKITIKLNCPNWNWWIKTTHYFFSCRKLSPKNSL